MAMQFGIISDADGASGLGIIQSFDIESSATIKTSLDASNETRAFSFDRQVERVQATYIYDGTAAPAAGSIITVDSVKYIVETARQTSVNVGYRQSEVSLVRWPDTGVPS